MSGGEIRRQSAKSASAPVVRHLGAPEVADMRAEIVAFGVARLLQ
jgi:hypothetical protein